MSAERTSLRHRLDLPVEDLLGVLALETHVQPVRAMEALLRRPSEALPLLLEAARTGLEEEFPNPLWPVVVLGELGRSAEGEDGRMVAEALTVPLVESEAPGEEEDDLWLGLAAAEAMAKIGEPALPVIEDLLGRGSERVRLFLYAALGWIGTDRAVERLLEAAETDLELADAVALALHDAGRREAIEPLHRLLSRCPAYHRVEVEDAIHSLHHGARGDSPLSRDWRLRYRPTGAFPFDAEWPCISALVRNEGPDLQRRRPERPVRPLEEILADPPDPELDPERAPCIICEEPGRVRFGVATCGRRHASLAAELLWSVLRPWQDEGIDDLFAVLGEADHDHLTLRFGIGPEIAEAMGEEGGLSGGEEAGGAGADAPQIGRTPAWDDEEEPLPGELLETECTLARQASVWFLERGVEDLGEALKRIGRYVDEPRRRPWRRGAQSEPRRVPDAASTLTAPPPGGRNAPCPCGSGKKYKKCCGTPGAAAPRERAPAPKLVGPDAEELTFGRSHYRVLDQDAVVGALDAAEDFEGDAESGFSWTGPPSGAMEAVPGARRVLAGVHFEEGGRLVLECFSRAGLERARARLERLAGDHLEHRADTLQDPWQALAERRGERRRDPDPEDEIPLDVRRGIVQKYMDAHYRDWLDEPVPALEGLTPRQASLLVLGRRRLEDLIQEAIEAEELRREQDGFAYDFTWLIRELGLEMEGPSEPG